MNQPAASSPRDIVHTVLQLIEQQRWDDVAAYVDRAALLTLHEQQLEEALREQQRQPETAEVYRRNQPDLPLEVAEYYAQQQNAHLAQGSHVLRQLGIGSIAELEQLSPAQSLGARLRAHDPRAMLRIEAERAAPQLAEYVAEVEAKQSNVIGEVIDGDTAYVVYVTGFMAPPDQVNIATLRRTAQGWLLLPRGELFGETGAWFGLGFGAAEGAPAAPPALLHQPDWTARTFDHHLEPELLPGVLERLRGTPMRAVDLLTGTLASVRLAKPDGTWSAQEHIGHLLDLEELNAQRLDDFRRRAQTLTAADMSNQKTAAAQHNAAASWELLEQFRTAREQLVAELERLPADVVAHRAQHPRLQRPMNVVEWIYFVCEHDDHHLARMREQIVRLMAERIARLRSQMSETQ